MNRPAVHLLDVDGPVVDRVGPVANGRVGPVANIAVGTVARHVINHDISAAIARRIAAGDVVCGAAAVGIVAGLVRVRIVRGAVT